MKFLVTGGAGFIGSNVAERLLLEGHDVVVFDNFSTGKSSNIDFLLAKDKSSLYYGDIRDREHLKKAMRGCDYVVHLAAIGSVPFSIENPLKTHDVNLTGTLNVLLAAKEEKVKRVIFASSSAIYGDMNLSPKIENMIPSPLSPYALSKIGGEHYCKIATSLFGLETISLRFFNIYGKKQDLESPYAAVIPIFINKMIDNQPPSVKGDGKQTRDFVYIDDCVQAILSACFSEEGVGEVFNVGNGIEISINDLVYKINKILKKDLHPVHVDMDKGDIKHSVSDNSKIKKYLKYAPSFSIDEGLEKTVIYYRKEKENERNC